MSECRKNPILSTVLMCHAPIVIPEIAEGRAREVRDSTNAMCAAAEQVRELNPDLLVVLSPHSPRRKHGFGLASGDVLRGDFADFGRPEISWSLPNDLTTQRLLLAEAENLGIDVAPTRPRELDHGTLVPLHFVLRAGWRGQVIVVSLPEIPDHKENLLFGHLLQAVANKSGKKWVLLASGDMSHRLTPGAPAGYHPRAHDFDSYFIEQLKSGNGKSAVTPDETLRDLAAEDVIDTTEIALAATNFSRKGRKVFSYEGPFGVGYCVAILNTGLQGMTEELLLATVPRAICAHLENRVDRLSDLKMQFQDPEAETATGVFVTIWKLSGPHKNLRGCIGTFKRRHKSLIDEIAHCAVESATEDPRFPVVKPSELPNLKYEISLLSPRHQVSSLSDLDPKRYGVWVKCGSRAGTLLPDIEGVDTAERQVQIALDKAGIGPDEPYEIWRYDVRKVAD